MSSPVGKKQEVMKSNATGTAKAKLGTKILKATKVEKGDVAIKKCVVAATDVFAFEDIMVQPYLLKMGRLPLKQLM
ncbi:MAG: hypothetical protein ACK53Y_10035 [bacterium]|jgi:hypothetical protein